MRSVIICISLLIASSVLGQKEETLLLEINSLPIKHGKIYEIQYYPGHGLKRVIDGVEITEASDSVFSVCSAQVLRVLDLGTEWAIILKDSTGLIFAYANLKTAFVKKGDIVSQGNFLGLVGQLEDGTKMLSFIICNSKGIIWSEKKTIEFLKKLQLPCNLQSIPIL